MAEGEASLDLQALINDVVERNRHVSGMALMYSEGSGSERVAPVVAGMPPPDDRAVAASNSAFYEGEDAGCIELGGHEFTVAERKEVGESMMVHLVPAGAKEAKDASITKAAEGDRQDGGLAKDHSDGDDQKNMSADVCRGAGAFLSPTKRWVLAVLHEDGMDPLFTAKVCIGMAEHLVDEGQ
eukprot:TRINITY_DN58690_c0_g1_i1.p1 TRINITY_DN58690_c0_g1~~TRINITY_DN58690_c0_g1_i1.p1  ORF type:complete len:201 (-),score=46.30 TRINITY_DN58690_c0_g1_i1:134-682(-)